MNLKKQETIGCCGIDCGLCPRFHASGDSACPGCGGLNFKEKHPSCGFLTCCVIKNGLEACADCKDFPCRRFDPEREGYDSFVSHRKVFENLESIKTNGIDQFIGQQKIRMDILTDFLTHFDDGRSKSFFCISCALLPLDALKETHRFMKTINSSMDIKERSKQLREVLLNIAVSKSINLKLNNKMKSKK